MMMQHPVVNDAYIEYDDIIIASEDVMLDKADWSERAKALLKAELKRRNVSYRELAEKLEKLGIQETERNIANKISRGGFTAAFMIQCLVAIDCHTLRLQEPS